MASRLRSQAWKLAARLRILPILPSLPPVQLAADTLIVGWTIGSALRPLLYVEAPMIPASTPAIKWGSWRERDDVLLTAGSAVIRAPEYGLLGMDANQQTVSWQQWTYDCIPAPNAIPPDTEGFQVLAASRPCQWPGTPGTMRHLH